MTVTRNLNILHHYVTGLGCGLTGYFHAIMTTGEFGYKWFSLFGTGPVGLKHKSDLHQAQSRLISPHTSAISDLSET